MVTLLARARLLGLLILLRAPAAWAGEVIGVVGVAEPPGPGPALAAEVEAVRVALAAHGEGVLEADALRQLMRAPRPSARLAGMEQILAAAITGEAEGEFEKANRTLHRLLTELDHLPEAAEVHALRLEVLARLARSEQELGRGDEALALLERILRLEPTHAVDGLHFPPSYVRLHEVARARVLALGAYRLTVEAEPGTVVFVDGRPVGEAPQVVDLAPGRHRVTGLLAGLRAPPQTVQLEGDRRVTLDTRLAGALRPEEGPGVLLGAAGRPLRLLELATGLGLDRLVAVERVDELGVPWLAAALVDVRQGGIVRDGRVRLAAARLDDGTAQALAAWLLQGRASALVRTARGPTLSAEALKVQQPAVFDREARRRALTWASAGTGVAALTLGTLAVFHARDAQAHYDEARDLLGSRRASERLATRYNGLIREGDGRRDSARVLGAASGVAFLTTGLLGYLAYRQSGEVGSFRF